MNRSNNLLVMVILATLGSSLSRPASAQFLPIGNAQPVAPGNIEGFTVTGKGSISAKPNRFEIDLEVSAASELSADAIVKYRDLKKRLHEAFAALKLENVTVEERGLLVDEKGAQINPYFFDGMPNRRSKTEVQLTRKLVVSCSDIRKLDEGALLLLVAKLLDVAQDAGGKVGKKEVDFNPYIYNRFETQSSGLVRFILDDFDKLEEQAYEKAVADAQTRAQRLAKLSQVKLGPVTSIREVYAPGAQTEIRSDDETPQQKRLTSSHFQQIPVRVELLVRFDVAKPAVAEGPNPR